MIILYATLGYITCFIITYYVLRFCCKCSRKEMINGNPGELPYIILCFIGPICILFYILHISFCILRILFNMFIEIIEYIPTIFDKKNNQETELEKCKQILREHNLL